MVGFLFLCLLFSVEKEREDTSDAIKYLLIFPISANGHSVTSSFIKAGREIIILFLVMMTLHGHVYLAW